MFLIIQTGEPVASAAKAFGGFDHMFTQAMKLADQQTKVVNVHHQQPLPPVAQAAQTLTGIVITGSAAMVTEQADWLLRTQHWLTDIMAHKVPILGVCFGHQVLADLLGGRVDFNPLGRNMGLSEMLFKTAAMTDPLLKDFTQKERIPTFVSHLQVAIELPQTSTLLGQCGHDAHHAFRAEDRVWGLQFHPEWNVDITRHYILARAEQLQQEGLDPDDMIAALRPCQQAYAMLYKFRQLAEQYRQQI